MNGPDEHANERCPDPRRDCQVMKIGPGEHAVITAPDTLLLRVLGSCVAACIRDPVALVGGMNHFMLPKSQDGRWGSANFSLRSHLQKPTDRVNFAVNSR